MNFLTSQININKFIFDEQGEKIKVIGLLDFLRLHIQKIR